MKRIVAMVAAAGLIVSACGGGDDDADDAGSEPTTESSEESADEPSVEAEPADEPSDDGGGDGGNDDAASDADSAGDAAPADDSDDATDDATDSATDDAEGTGGDDAGADDSESDDADSGGSGPVIRSIDDVPQECRDEMAAFLRDVEPIVSPIDWQNATLADFESIAADFEAQSDLFDQTSSASGCNDLRFADDDDSLNLLIEFAGREAPGAVGFLEFLNNLQGNFPVDTGGGDTGGGDDGGGDDGGGDAGGGDDGGGDDPGGSDGFETCAEAVDFVQSLIDTYDSFSDVPAAQLLQFSNLSTVFITCTPSELEFFDSDEFNDFFGS